VKLQEAEALAGAWRIAQAAARDIDVDLKSHAVTVGALETSGGKLDVERHADGGFEIPRLPPSKNRVEKNPVEWKVAVGKVHLDGYAVALHDASARPALTHRFTLATVEGGDLSTDHTFTGRMTAKVRTERGASLDVDATFALEPLEVKATLDARNIDLVPARAYLTQFPSVSLRSGLASASGTLGLQGKADALRITYNGSAQVDRFATFDTLNREELLNWKRVKATGLRLDHAPGAPFRLAVADIDVQDAYSRIFVNPEGKLNVQQLIAATPEDPKAAPPPPRHATCASTASASSEAASTSATTSSGPTTPRTWAT